MERFVRRAPSVAAAVALAVAVAAGCAQRVDGPGGPDLPARAGGGPRVQPTWVSCDKAAPRPSAPLAFPGGNDALTLPRLGDDFVPVAAVICGTGPQKRPDGGTDMVATESRATDVADLVAALRLPDLPGTAQACTLQMEGVPWLALLDADGRWVRPGIPIGPCGRMRPEVRKAITALHLVRVASRVQGEIESGEAAASGCGQGWADMVWAETHMGARIEPGPLGSLPFGGSQVRACVFAVPAAQQRTGKPGGQFVHGGLLPPDRRALVEKALLAAGPAKPCEVPAGRFAVLSRPDHRGGEVYVELDGCRRILAEPVQGPRRLAQGDAALAALLD